MISLPRNDVIIYLYLFCFFSECFKSYCGFLTVKRLHILGSRESRSALSLITSCYSSSYTSLGVSCHGHERGCRSVSSTSNGGKDKNGKGPGNQWSCPKCGNPCTTLERKFVPILHFHGPSHN